MNALEEQIIRAVAEGRVTAKTRALAKHYLAHRERRAAAAAARACTTAPVAKKAIASVEHHRRARRAEDRAMEETSVEVWNGVLNRTARDHRGRFACEGCHRSPLRLEPHHLEPGSGNRTDALHLVMALCPDCHTLARLSAHRAPLTFARTVVIPWAQAHGYPLPNRKEYRT